MKGSNSYQERQSEENIGERLFEEYCTSMGYQFNRLGFDEKNKFVPNYFRINSMIRNLPDFIVSTKDETFVVAVKGTANFKKKEIDKIPLFLEWYSSKEAPFVYAFCFEGQKPKLIFPERIIQLYESSKDQKWSDGVVYRNLEI